MEAAERDDYHLRALVDRMVRAGSNERDITRAVRDATRVPCHRSSARRPGRLRSIRPALRRMRAARAGESR